MAYEQEIIRLVGYEPVSEAVAADRTSDTLQVLKPLPGAAHSDEFRVCTQIPPGAGDPLGLAGYLPIIADMDQRSATWDPVDRGTAVGSYNVTLIDAQVAGMAKIKRWLSSFFGGAFGASRLIGCLFQAEVYDTVSLEWRVLWAARVVGIEFTSEGEAVLDFEDISSDLLAKCFVFNTPSPEVKTQSQASVWPTGVMTRSSTDSPVVAGLAGLQVNAYGKWGAALPMYKSDGKAGARFEVRPSIQDGNEVPLIVTWPDEGALKGPETAWQWAVSSDIAQEGVDEAGAITTLGSYLDLSPGDIADIKDRFGGDSKYMKEWKTSYADEEDTQERFVVTHATDTSLIGKTYLVRRYLVGEHDNKVHFFGFTLAKAPETGAPDPHDLDVEEEIYGYVIRWRRPTTEKTPCLVSGWADQLVDDVLGQRYGRWSYAEDGSVYYPRTVPWTTSDGGPLVMPAVGNRGWCTQVVPEPMTIAQFLAKICVQMGWGYIPGYTGGVGIQPQLQVKFFSLETGTSAATVDDTDMLMGSDQEIGWQWRQSDATPLVQIQRMRGEPYKALAAWPPGFADWRPGTKYNWEGTGTGFAAVGEEELTIAGVQDSQLSIGDRARALEPFGLLMTELATKANSTLGGEMSWPSGRPQRVSQCKFITEWCAQFTGLPPAQTTVMCHSQGNARDVSVGMYVTMALSSQPGPSGVRGGEWEGICVGKEDGPGMIRLTILHTKHPEVVEEGFGDVPPSLPVPYGLAFTPNPGTGDIYFSWFNPPEDPVQWTTATLLGPDGNVVVGPEGPSTTSGFLLMSWMWERWRFGYLSGNPDDVYTFCVNFVSLYGAGPAGPIVQLRLRGDYTTY